MIGKGPANAVWQELGRGPAGVRLAGRASAHRIPREKMLERDVKGGREPSG